MIDRLFGLAPSQQLLRYFGASAFALGIDMGFFLLLLGAGMLAPAASAISYCMGIAGHWLVSSRIVFAAGAAPRGSERWRQKFLFLASALVGLVLTVSIVTLGEMLLGDARVAKLVAVAVSFFTGYLMRKHIVFSIG
jgi:putative flippase GtrA